MIRYLLDTNIISYLMKKNHPQHSRLINILLQQEEGSVAVSVMTISEIAQGLDKIEDESRKKILQEAFDLIFSSIIVLEFNDEAAWMYGSIRNQLCRDGQDIDVMGTLIAAHAISQNLILITNNSKHFQRISKLNIENWIE